MRKIKLLMLAAMTAVGLCACRSSDREIKNSGGDTSGQEENSIVKEGRQYTWQEITITLPKEWEECCVISEDDNGFSIYQKASYNKDTGSGYVCGFQRTKEYMNYGLGETLLAYTDDGTLYYFMQPTDVSCDSEDRNILDEYAKMGRQAEEIINSVQITADGIHLDAKEYILPVSSILELDQNVLLNLSDNSLWIARNEIYARHGRKFSNEYLQKYFNRCTWYKGNIPSDQFDDSKLSSLEKENIRLLSAAEQEYKKQHPYPKEYQAELPVHEDLDGDGKTDIISYQVTEWEDGVHECMIDVNGNQYRVDELVDMTDPFIDVFYITDISEYDGMLEIAVLDNGPSDDPVTYFFRYKDGFSYIGQTAGFPFAEQNGGVNGFNGTGGITGRVRMDLIGTLYMEGYWMYENQEIVYQEMGWNRAIPADGHTLYTDLSIYNETDEGSAVEVIPAQTEVFFLGSDLKEWVLVKSKNGQQGYIHVENGKLAASGQSVYEIFSNLRYSD